MATPRKPASTSGAKRTGTAAAAQQPQGTSSTTTTTGESAAVDPSSTTAAADPPAAAPPAAAAASSTPTPSTSDPPSNANNPMPPEPPVPPVPMPTTTLFAQLLELLQSSQHQTKMVHSAGTALGVWMTLWITWYVLVVSWTYSSGGTGVDVIRVDVNANLQRSIAELEKINDQLQIQLDEHHLAIDNVRDRRIELQPLRERFMSLRQQALDSRLADSGSDEQDKEGEQGRTKTSVVDVTSFPRLHVLVTHLRRRRQEQGGDQQDDNRVDDASTAVVRELFFMARNELYLHTQQDSELSTMSKNYTVVNSLLQSYKDLSTSWYDILPIPKNCRTAATTDNSEATATASWTPSDIEAWISSNTEVQDRLVLVQQLLDDRVGIDDREWKVALEDTYDRVQQRYMEVASTTNSRIFQHMKDLQQHLDHWEVREAQKGSSTAASYEGAAKPNNQCAQPSQVLHWIDVALDAHYRNRSVHEAVLTALRLDANVPPSHVDLAESELAVDSTHVKPQGRRRRRFPPSLRLLLDTPLLHQSETWIDQFVEYLEGRHDTVDAFVDGLAARAAAAAAAANAGDGVLPAAPGSAGDASSIGHYVVQSFLTGVGRVVDDKLLPPWRNDEKSKSMSPSS